MRIHICDAVPVDIHGQMSAGLWVAAIIALGYFLIVDLRQAFGSGTASESASGSASGSALDSSANLVPKSIGGATGNWPAPVSQIQDYGRAVGDMWATPQIRGPLASTPMPMSGPLFMQYNDPAAYERLMREQVAGPPMEANHWQSWSPVESYDGKRVVSRLSPNLGTIMSFDAAVAMLSNASDELRNIVVGEFYSAGRMQIFLERKAAPALSRLAGRLWMSDEQMNDGQWRVSPFIDQTHEPQLIVDVPEGQRRVIRIKQNVDAGDCLVVVLRPTTNSDTNGFICRLVSRGVVLLSGGKAFAQRATGGLVLCPEPNTTISAQMEGAAWMWPVECALTACESRVRITL